MGYKTYKRVYMPDYHCANPLGYVFVYVYVAEQVLCRHLMEGEVVYHLDKNIYNNYPDNIIVFKSEGDLSRYRAGGNLVLMDDGAYISEDFSKLIPCKYCGTMFEPKKSNIQYCCIECAQLDHRRVIRPTKRELKKLLMEFNMNQISKIYGVASNSIRRWCLFYGLPYKKKAILKMKEQEMRKAAERARQKELKEHCIERDRQKKYTDT